MGRGGLEDLTRDFLGLAGGGSFDADAKSRLESCFAVIPIYLLARDPTEIFNSAILDASAEVIFRFLVSVGDASPCDEAADPGRTTTDGDGKAIFVDATKTPHLGGQVK